MNNSPCKRLVSVPPSPSNFCLLLSLFTLIHLAPLGSAQQNPSISFISQETVVEIGDTLTLKCITQFARDYPVNWLKIDNENHHNDLFISSGQSVHLPNSRYHVKVEEAPEAYSATKTFNLVVDKIQEVDAGQYSCQVITGQSGRVIANTNVIIQIPPIISDNSTRSVIAAVGQRVDLYCHASGYPLPAISWRREKNRLIPGYGAIVKGNKLSMYNVTKDDRGTYYCVADNGVYPGGRRSIGVEIEFLPFVSAEKPRYGQALQYDSILTCHIESFPSASVEWIKDGMRITDNYYYEISHFSTSEEFIDTSIRVRRIEKKQYGDYYCKATNKLGSDMKKIELFETVDVICPPACDSLTKNFSGAISISSTLWMFLVSLMSSTLIIFFV